MTDLEIATGELHWDGPPGLLWGTVLAGLVADVAFVYDGRLLLSEQAWPVIEMYENLLQWRTAAPEDDFVYADSIEGPNDHAPTFRNLGDGKWAIGTIDVQTPKAVITAAQLDMAISRFRDRMEGDFPRVIGMGLQEWQERRISTHPEYVGKQPSEIRPKGRR